MEFRPFLWTYDGYLRGNTWHKSSKIYQQVMSILLNRLNRCTKLRYRHFNDIGLKTGRFKTASYSTLVNRVSFSFCFRWNKDVVHAHICLGLDDVIEKEIFKQMTEDVQVWFLLIANKIKNLQLVPALSIWPPARVTPLIRVMETLPPPSDNASIEISPALLAT